ncbi:cytochrome c [Leptospira mtsangambouensis]|uniref:Cytochrome c n=1 Tax=Leptospira mtsangambouensis TaxID=2484912 RepID=A0ABY2NXD5_9LEPT|nr:cytochrome c [Leptospira mtsangambouensis]TGM72901.1 cytochrome c [Leptospira mtsangambouensis]
MDFPIFHLDFMGNRLLIAVIAILHVLINHSLAVGLAPLVTYFEYLGWKNKSQEMDQFANKVMFVGFVITTSLGAMTGVGIWLSASLVSPASIGSLIRVFFWAWFTEWIVFVTEVVLILLYFLTWKKSLQSEDAKKKHIKFGIALSIFSWITMAIIVAILSFMMDPGSWSQTKSFVDAVINPVYMAQLAFRTPVAMFMAGTVVLFLSVFFTKKGSPLRKSVTKTTSIWILSWSIWVVVGSIFYYSVIPDMMANNLSIAVGTMEFSNWYDSLLVVMGVGIISVIGISLYSLSGKNLPIALSIIPVLISFSLLTVFERAREFIRKPFVIGNYMYSNMFRIEEYPLLQKEGILKHATYVKQNSINDENIVEAGKDIFLLTCSRCHTSHGINSVVKKFQTMYGSSDLNPDGMVAYIQGMHNARYFMPPFPGSELEMKALVTYIQKTKDYPIPTEGAQETGVTVSIKRGHQ